MVPNRKETLVKLKSYCAMDLHHSHTVIEGQTKGGQVIMHRDMATEAAYLIEFRYPGLWPHSCVDFSGNRGYAVSVFHSPEIVALRWAGFTQGAIGPSGQRETATGCAVQPSIA